MEREELQGQRAAAAEAAIPTARQEELAARVLEMGLESAPSVQDRSIPLFSRDGPFFAPGGALPFAGINTFMRAPFVENVRDAAHYDVAFVGVPLDTGTTYRPGTRFGPQGMRRISGLASTYNFELGIDLIESIRMCDVGDVHVIPANLEKSFDQISLAMATIHQTGAFPVILGGDHSIGYPNVRGLAPLIDGNIGIIHFDRHADTSESNFDERMHGTPWFHATNIPNAPPANLVQIGIGGWTATRDGTRVCRERSTTIITMDDIESMGLARTAEMALDIAWKNARTVYLSFDIDSCDPAYAPGTGTPEPGGLTPREAFSLLGAVAREGLCGMEVVEVSPPYDHSDITSLLAVRTVLYVLGNMVKAGKLGSGTVR